MLWKSLLIGFAQELKASKALDTMNINQSETKIYFWGLKYEHLLAVLLF